MTNLIVTVLAVAILAAASVTGIYYGGVYYANARASAMASTLVSQATQLASMWRSWSRDYGGDTAAGSVTKVKLITTLTNYASYFTSLPQPDPVITMQSSSNSGADKVFALMNSKNYGTSSTVDAIMMEFQTNSREATAVCNKIALMAGGSSGTPKPKTVGTLGGDDYSPRSTEAFNCTKANSGSATDAELKFFVYKVF